MFPSRVHPSLSALSSNHIQQYKSSLPKAQSQTHTQSTQPSAKSQNHSFLALKLKLLLCVFFIFLNLFIISLTLIVPRDHQVLQVLFRVILSFWTTFLYSRSCSAIQLYEVGFVLFQFLWFTCYASVWILRLKKKEKKKERGRVLLSWARYSCLASDICIWFYFYFLLLFSVWIGLIGRALSNPRYQFFIIIYFVSLFTNLLDPCTVSFAVLVLEFYI